MTQNVSRGMDNLRANLVLLRRFIVEFWANTRQTEVAAHVGDAHHRTPSDTEFEVVGLPVQKIWLIIGRGVKRPGDFDLSPFDV